MLSCTGGVIRGIRRIRSIADPGEAGGVEREAYGFLTVVESQTHGLFGGYLLVDAGGRPLEFHCTTPVTISRAQAILYGPTLDADVRGRQIGAALLAEASMLPQVVLVDESATAAVREHTRVPVAIVQSLTAVEAPASEWLRVGEARVRMAVTAGADPVDPPPLPPFDLLEPFERIRAAIDEVQRHG